MHIPVRTGVVFDVRKFIMSHLLIVAEIRDLNFWNSAYLQRIEELTAYIIQGNKIEAKAEVQTTQSSAKGNRQPKQRKKPDKKENATTINLFE